MTLIVALRQNNELLIGHDSCVNGCNLMHEIGQSKVVFGVGWAVAISGPIAVENVLQTLRERNIPPPPLVRGGDVERRWAIQEFVPAFRQELKAAEQWLPSGENGAQVAGGCDLILMLGTAMYEIAEDLSVLKMKTDWLLAGDEVCKAAAHGSLHTTRKWKGAQTRIWAALEAATTLRPHACRPPYVLESSAPGGI